MVYIQPDLLASKLEKIFSNTSQNFKNVVITMNLYVHVMEEEKVKEIEKIDNVLKIV